MGKTYPSATVAPVAVISIVLIVVSIVTLIVPLNLHADTHDHGEHFHQEGAHQHGLAEVMLALEGDSIDLSLESPAANIVGFEHVASTPEQRGLVDEARTILKTPERLFTFLGTACELKALDIDVSAVLVDEEHGHHHSDHDKSKHETHSEVSANYRFYCEQGSRLTAITLNFFEHFPGIEILKAVWVTDKHQGSIELSGESNTVYLR